MKNKSNTRKEVVRIASSDATVVKFAQVCKDAMDIREWSYNKEASKLETETERRKAERAPIHLKYMHCVDYSQFYEMDMHESCIEACKRNGLSEEMALPIYLSFHWSNDLLDWANEMLGI